MRISESENKSTTFTGRQTSPVREHTYCRAVLKSHPFYISQTPIKHEWFHLNRKTVVVYQTKTRTSNSHPTPGIVKSSTHILFIDFIRCNRYLPVKSPARFFEIFAWLQTFYTCKLIDVTNNPSWKHAAFMPLNGSIHWWKCLISDAAFICVVGESYTWGD